MYFPKFDDVWKKYFENLPNHVKIRVSKKIKNILEEPKKRHLRFGLDYFVAEAGQYRITYKINDDNNTVEFYFVGNHKEYEKWYNFI